MAVQYLKPRLPNKALQDLTSITRTAITGKTLENALDAVSALCVDAVKKAGDAESVKVVSFPGGSLEDSYTI